MLQNIYFTVPEILSLLGLAQCIYILVYMLFRSGRLSRGTLPALYFIVLGLAFLFDAAERYWGPVMPSYDQFQWLFWFSGPPLSTLLILQVARITRLPTLEDFLILLLIPAAYFGALLLSATYSDCVDFATCEDMRMWLVIYGLGLGAVSLLAIWFRRAWLDNLHAQKGGQERFWLIIALIVLNATFLAVMLSALYGIINFGQAGLIRTILGIAFVYIASTSLFRIYPKAVRIDPPKGSRPADETLSDTEIELALAVERLMNVEKVYQEPSYGRADLARELKTTEPVLSRVVNLYFGKSVPQFLNEYRVADAERLLHETRAPVRIIAEEAGFNSIATFNRVFKDLKGISPSIFRKDKE